ncbi:hypothetical protein MKA46_21320, partial [[Clostridium] innocuum]|nr:hypothetical protein [[Clostridium] innocuum]
LYAKLTQDKFDADVVYTWHHKTADGKDNDAEISGSGKSYLLRGKDVGLQIYVKATAKKEGGADGSTKATIDAKVKKAATPAPNSKPELVSREDISLKVKLPDEVRQGLYQFGYIQQGVDDEIVPFDILTRGSNPVTITGLTPNKMYYIYVRQIGEDGYEDSSWSSGSLEQKTDYPHVVGTVEITASNDLTAFGQTLNATIKNGSSTQKGVWNWYRIDADGTRSSSLSTDDYYEINDSRDIGAKIEAVYSGDKSKFYAGEISAQSEEVKKAEVPAPKKMMASNMVSATDSTISFTLPEQDTPTGALGVDERYIVGYSLSENGVPVEYREDDTVQEYKPQTPVTLKNLKRDTTYYLFLRYAEQDEHYKSDWSAVDRRVMKKTEKTALSGSMDFAYAGTNALKPVQGEKLVAKLNAPNVKEGTWEWWRIENGEETKILNFFPEGDDATYYMIPSDETVGTTYKVKFTPVSGYSGSFTQISAEVLKYEREKYDAPTAAPQGTRQSDTTVTFKMGDDADEGIVYEFQYGTEDAVDSDQNKLVETKAYKGTDVTITGLNRNTGYHIWVRRARDDNKDASEWCTSKLSMKTEQTEIHGYVSIDGIDTAGKELIATYNQASYIPTGNDGSGTWKWYRESSGGSYTEITTGITSTGVESRYTPTGADIGKKLKVEYTGTGDFKASKTAVTTSIKKNVAKDPVINKIKQGDDTADSHLCIEIELDTIENVWYMIKDSNTEVPQIPSGTSEDVMTDAKWTKATSTKMEATKDVEGKYYAANTKYTLYILKQESADTQVSNLISREVELGTM